MTNKKSIDEVQKAHWQSKFGQHSKEIQSIGSESPLHKNLRYQKIAEVLKDQNGVSLLDVGAGFGDYFGYLQQHYLNHDINYTGAEITPEFCEIAREKYPDINMIHENILERTDLQFDFVQMSGLFHQNGEVPPEDWKNFMLQMITHSFSICKKGISLNVLSNTVDFKREGNFYVDVDELYSFLCSKVSRHIIIDQSYPLFEATVHVFRKEFVREQYTDQAFEKYLK